MRFVSSMFVALTILLKLSPAVAEAPVNTNSSAYAVGGYDVVAYFKDKRPEQGKAEFAAHYHGATWLFASAAHKALFEKQPDAYAPAYEGYCAYGVANGRLVKIDPDAWTILHGKLYLNYSLDVRTKWLNSPDAFIKTANATWPKLSH